MRDKGFRISKRLFNCLMHKEFALEQRKQTLNIKKDFFLFLHGKMDLKQKATDVLTAKGCSDEKITMGVPTKVGNVGDYMVQLWPPGPAPNQIKIHRLGLVWVVVMKLEEVVLS